MIGVVDHRSRAAKSNVMTEIETWSKLVDILPIPAALVDGDGRVIHGNRWIDADLGDPLVTSADDEVAPGLRFGVDDRSRWRVRPLTTTGSGRSAEGMEPPFRHGAGPDDDMVCRAGEKCVMLATGEREDSGDHLLRRFFATGDTLFVVYDQWGRIIESNPAWENLLGYSHDEVFGLDSWSLLPPDDGFTQARLEAELREHGRCDSILPMRAADGSYRDVQWALHFDATVGRCFGLGRDVTEEKRLKAELHRRANTDPLTGLANRTQLLDVLNGWLAHDASPAVLFCDLDRFKVVNDSLGHQAGDDLLAELGHRLEAMARAPDAFVARLGGDEFVAVLGQADLTRAVRAAEEMLRIMQEPFVVAGRPVHVTMSIGIAVAGEHPGRPSNRPWDGNDGFGSGRWGATPALDANTLLGQADTAAYKAKQLGRNRLKIFDAELRATVNRRFNVEEGLRRALDDDRIEVHYQPIVQLPGTGIIGMEALVRWRDDDGRLIGPGDFLDVADEAALLGVIGRRVMERAMATAADFARRGRSLWVSVNVSASELSDGDFGDRLLGIIADADLDPGLVVLEITESAVLHTDAALPTLSRLRQAGLRVGLDDFGTGFSSLAHLRELPIDVVKIDRTFVRDLIHGNVTRALTASLVDLCRALGLLVILEGVETTEQASAVEQVGGSLAQGFLFYRPMPRSDLESILGLSDRPPRRQSSPGHSARSRSPVRSHQTVEP